MKTFNVKARLAPLAIVALVSSSFASAADWYLNVTPTFGRIEQDINGRIWLMVPPSNPGNPVLLSGQSSTCNVTSVQLIPPTGHEKDWLAMVLSATMGGRTLSVWGDCLAASYRVDASRLIIDY